MILLRVHWAVWPKVVWPYYNLYNYKREDVCPPSQHCQRVVAAMCSGVGIRSDMQAGKGFAVICKWEQDLR